MLAETAYRPHDPGHDYYEPGIYLITLVVRNRAQQSELFGSLNNNLRQPRVNLMPIGKAVMEEWEKIPSFEEKKGRKIRVHNAVCMPDHFHGIIEVMERMDASLGQVIWGFKVACSKHWHELVQPKTAEQSQQRCLRAGLLEEQRQPSLAVGQALDLHRLSKKQRAEYYAKRPREEQPLWDDNYDDTICIDAEHLRRMMHYVDDNPRRAIMRRLRPQFMQRCLHVIIDGRSYAAFGNMFLLRWARKVQVFCHRRARFGQLTARDRQRFGINYEALPETETSIPYEQTDAYAREREAWIAQIMRGQTVIVTPGISKGEQGMKDECLDRGYPLIHLQKEPIGRYWKPEAKRFEACTRGRLLILAPYNASLPQPFSPLGEKGVDTKKQEGNEPEGISTPFRRAEEGKAKPGIEASDYAIFHNLNALAAELCAFDGEARIVND